MTASTRRSRAARVVAALALALTVGLLSAGSASAVTASATMDPVSGPIYTSVHLTGTYTITAFAKEEQEAGQACYYTFEYSPDGVNWSGFIYEPCEPFEAHLGPQDVAGTITGLAYGTEYHLRLHALYTYGDQSSYSAEQIITTEPEPTTAPTLATAAASQVEYTRAHLSGTIDPHGGNQTAGGDAVAIKWHFQYSTDPVEFGWTDGPGGEITGAQAEANGPIAVAADPTGLENHAIYSYRLVADYGDLIATSPEPDRTVETLQVIPPIATFDAVSAITDTSAHFAGHVKPEAPGAAPQDPGFDTEWNFVCTPACPGLTAQTVAADNGSHEVSVDASGLEPSTAYQVTLEATNKGGTDTDTKGFTTKTPLASVTSTPGGSDGQGGYILQGIVNPKNSSPDCYFEYGTTATYPNTYKVACAPMPAGVNHAVTVEAHVGPLTIDATYHVRLFVTNSAGTVSTPDQIFIPTLTPRQNCPNEQAREENSSLALPECRAYEMVSASEKGGYPARAFGLGEGSPDAVGYSTLAGNIAGSGQGSIGQNYYVSRRTEHGWETIPGLNGADGSLSSGPQALEYPVVLPNFYANDLLTSAWMIEPLEKSYYHKRPWLRNQDGTFTKIGDAADQALNGNNSNVSLAGLNTHYSGDLTHLLFDGTQNGSIGGSAYGPGVYEFVGTGNTKPTRRVDIDNSGAPIGECGPAAQAGRFAFNDDISANGRTSVVTVNGGGFCETPPTREIWARVDGKTSYDVSESLCTRTAGDPGGACNAGSNPTFLSVSNDGSRVLFTSNQQLVNGDTDQTNDIYACDLPSSTPAPGKRGNPCAPLTEVSGAASGAAVEQVLATSEDGSTAYFIAGGVLADDEGPFGETAKAGGHNLYVWRQTAADPGGETKFVVALEDPSDVAEAMDSFHPHEGEQPQTTDDGRYFVLVTKNKLLPTDTDESRDVYRYDAESGEISRVSVNSSGIAGNGPFDAEIVSPKKLYNYLSGAGGQTASAYPHPAVSNNGKVVFITQELLTPIDGNAAPDTYLWTEKEPVEGKPLEGKPSEGKTSLITTASVGSMEPPAGSTVGSRNPNQAFIDKSGESVYFTSPQELVPSDGDDVGDVYVARVNGGFKSSVPSSCAGEACQPPPSSAPNPPNPLTAGGGGEGNVKPKHCAKGKALVKGKCVKKKHHKKKHHKKKGKSKPAANRGGVK